MQQLKYSGPTFVHTHYDTLLSPQRSPTSCFLTYSHEQNIVLNYFCNKGIHKRKFTTLSKHVLPESMPATDMLDVTTHDLSLPQVLGNRCREDKALPMGADLGEKSLLGPVVKLLQWVMIYSMSFSRLPRPWAVRII